MTTKYVTVRLTELEAYCLLIRANSGSYEYDHDDAPEIAGPSDRAEAKIRMALKQMKSQLASPKEE